MKHIKYYDIVNSIIRGERLFDIPLRVTYYCRVSTDSDVQMNSLANQISYYKEYIKSKSNWTLVEGYIDEGISGVSVEKRNAFKKMIEDGKKHQFDLVITKEVSRFARDLEDSIHYIRLLKESGIGILFENQNLNTFDPNSELILNIMFNLAQDESRKLSSRVKFGHNEAIKKGHILGSSNILGYQKEKCKLIIKEEEAVIVRKIFELYSTGNYGFYKLSKTLATLGYYNKKGKFYDKETLKRIIQNPKYKGYYRGKTTEVMDYRTKKRIRIAKNNQIIYKDVNIPLIVSEELWDKANQIISERSNKYKECKYSGGLKYPLSSKIYCKEHNSTFQRSTRDKKKNNSNWACNQYLKYHLDACESPILKETELYNIFNNIISLIIPQKEIINDLSNLYAMNNSSMNHQQEIEKIEDKINKIENKKKFTLDLLYEKQLSKNDLLYTFKEFNNSIKSLTKMKNQLLNQIKTKNKRNNLKKVIENELSNGFFHEFIKHFVDEIIVSKINDKRNNVHLDIYLKSKDYKQERKKGARHLTDNLYTEECLLKNQQYNYIEKQKSKKNKYIYDVFIY